MTSSRKALAGWCLFDVANSAYTTLIITVAYNVIFTKLIVGADTSGNYARGNHLWAWTLAASWLIAAFAGPWLGAWSDAKAARKKMLIVSVLLCCIASSALAAAGSGDVALAVILVVISNLGFSLSENFIAAFLPAVASPREMGKISGVAWGLGYFGGLASILLCQAATGLDYSAENWSRLWAVGPLTAAFFLIGSLPALFWLKEPPAGPGEKRVFLRMWETARHLRSHPDLCLLLLSCFFFQGSLAIVISFAAIYGEQVVGLTGSWQAIFFLSLQITAALGAFFFGWLQSRWSGLKALDVTLYVWLTTIVVILCVGESKLWFLIAGNLAGLCLGATQSVARALVGQMAPEGRSGEVFGLWGFSGKLAMVFALVVFGWLQTVIGLKPSLGFCAVWFCVSLIVHRFIDEKRSLGGIGGDFRGNFRRNI